MLAASSALARSADVVPMTREHRELAEYLSQRCSVLRVARTSADFDERSTRLEFAKVARAAGRHVDNSARRSSRKSRASAIATADELRDAEGRGDGGWGWVVVSSAREFSRDVEAHSGCRVLIGGECRRSSGARFHSRRHDSTPAMDPSRARARPLLVLRYVMSR